MLRSQCSGSHVIITIFLASVSLCSTTSAQPTTKPLQESSKDGAEAKRQFTDALEKFKREFFEKASAAQAQYIKRLEVVMAAETRKGNLEGALSVREELDLQKRQVPLGNTLPPILQLAGRWHVRMASGYECDYLIAPDKVQQLTTHLVTSVTTKEQSLVARWGNGNTDRYTFAAGRMLIEYWGPSQRAFIDKPTTIGIGEPAK